MASSRDWNWRSDQDRGQDTRGSWRSREQRAGEQDMWEQDGRDQWDRDGDLYRRQRGGEQGRDASAMTSRRSREEDADRRFGQIGVGGGWQSYQRPSRSGSVRGGTGGEPFVGEHGENIVGGRDFERWGGGYDSQHGKRDFWDRATDEVASWFGDEDAQRRRERDEHRGRGPKNYTRPDERIREDINDRLTEDGALDASDIEVQVSGCEVTLVGEVNSRWDKRRAEDLADMVSGVRHVQNNLRLKPRSGTSATAMTMGSGTNATAAANALNDMPSGQKGSTGNGGRR